MARGSPPACSGWPKPGIAFFAARSRATRRPGILAAFDQPVKEAARRLGAAEHDAAAAEQAGRDRALEGLGRRRIGDPRRDHARHQAMLGDRGQHRVGEEALGLARRLAGDEQPEIGGEVGLADQLARTNPGPAP